MRRASPGRSSRRRASHIGQAAAAGNGTAASTVASARSPRAAALSPVGS